MYTGIISITETGIKLWSLDHPAFVDFLTIRIPPPGEISVDGLETVSAAPARRPTVSSHTMPDSPRRELHADVTYAHVGLVFGFLLMNESSRSAWSRVTRAHAHARGARALSTAVEWILHDLNSDWF